MRGHDPLDLRHLAAIVSLSSNKARIGKPELRTPTMSLKEDVGRLSSVVHAEPKRIAGLPMKRWHTCIVGTARYQALTIGL